MQYMCLIYEAEGRDMTPEEQQAFMGEYYAFTEAVKKAGVFVAGDALDPAASAKSVRIRDGEQMVTDGPFAETKEALGGYYLLDVENEAQAIEWAAKIPSSKHGTIEVRPVMVFD